MLKGCKEEEIQRMNEKGSIHIKGSEQMKYKNDQKKDSLYFIYTVYRERITVRK